MYKIVNSFNVLKKLFETTLVYLLLFSGGTKFCREQIYFSVLGTELNVGMAARRYLAFMSTDGF